MRRRTERPSASDISVTLRRLGRNRRLVLILEWLTLWPTWADLPVNSQRRDIARPFRKSNARAKPARNRRAKGARLEGGPIKTRPNAVNACADRHPPALRWRPLAPDHTKDLIQREILCPRRGAPART